ncbi:hypothetical protein [Halomonas maura]|uniref:Y-family DNA polymerase n=1 Tax=Halomonas maura TaxID=117606 RepID=UPI0025B42A53|nr:hypothetical protein [Halomonas maura]MDN3557390.1 hypothetical protein [Halomonas maura]
MHLLPPAVRRQATLLSSHYALYGDMSRRVNPVLGEFSPDVEVYPIDESFVGERRPPRYTTRWNELMRVKVR